MTDERRIVILAEGHLEPHHGKTAFSILMFRPELVRAVIDSEHAGQTTQEVTGLGGDIPIVQDIEEALRVAPDANELLIGIATRGGQLPEEWRPQLMYAISHGLDLVNGLHTMLNSDEGYVQAARQHGTRLVDVRDAPANLEVAALKPRRPGSHTITFVGSDCAVGKMTAALAVTNAAREMGISAAFVATGQTGIMLEGSGIAIDHVISDFTAGAVEQLVVEASQHADLVFVEGQGSLLHPGYSGVTLSLLHGSHPDAMILVHDTSRTCIDEYDLPLPDLDRLVQIYEDAAGWVKPAPVVGIALNTRTLDPAQTDFAIAEAEAITGLPASDPVKFGGEKLVRAVLDAVGVAV